MKDRGDEGPEAQRGHREDEGRDRAKEIEREIANIERVIDHGAKGDHEPVPHHNDHRDSDHRPFRRAATPGGIKEGNQQDSGENRDAHARHYSCRLPPVNSPYAADAIGVAPAAACAGHSRRS